MNYITNTIIYLLIAFFCLLASEVFAVPTHSLFLRDLPLYDVKYIKANFIKDRIPPKDSCIFYVGPFKQNAINLAASDCKGWTLYQSYFTANCFDETVDPFKSYKAQQQVRPWFSITSRAFAQVCTGKVRIIFPLAESFPPESIWITDELDAILKGETGVTYIEQCDPDSTATRPYPVQPPVDALGDKQPPDSSATEAPLPSKARSAQTIRDISCLDEIQAMADSMPDVEGCEGCEPIVADSISTIGE